MSTDARARAVERVQKLLRLAAPGNGTTEAERTSAALEVAKIIAEHGLAVAVPEPVVKKRRSPPRSHAQPQPPPQRHHSYEYRQWSPPSGSDWTEADVPTRCNCVVCGRLLIAGEVGWFAPDHGYRHYDITCDR
jgi:hypothetical protein